MRRILTLAITTVAIMTLTATAALAHFCYNASRSTTGNLQAGQHAPVLVPVADLPAILGHEIGLCEAGQDHLYDWAEARDLLDRLVNAKVVMSGGTLQTRPSLSTDGTGIDHLPQYVLEEAFLLCPPPPA